MTEVVSYRELREAGGLEGLERRMARARQREERGEDGMNATERAYVHEVLVPRKLEGAIHGFLAPCPVKFRLGPDWTCALEPDVLIVEASGVIALVDAKAAKGIKRDDGTVYYRPLMHDDARVKLQTASRLFPIFRWRVAYKPPSGGWVEEEIG